MAQDQGCEQYRKRTRRDQLGGDESGHAEGARYDGPAYATLPASIWVGAVPDATSLLRFQPFLEQHKLGKKLFAEVDRTLQAKDFTNERLSNNGEVDKTQRARKRAKLKVGCVSGLGLPWSSG